MNRTLVLLASAAAIAIAGSVSCDPLRFGTARGPVLGSAFEGMLDAGPPAWLPGDSLARARAWAELRSFYAARDRQLAWIERFAPSGEARALAEALEHTSADGLEPARYGLAAIRTALDSAATLQPADADSLQPALAELELRLSAGFLRAARELRAGRFPPAVLDSDWVALRDTLDAPGLLAEVLAQHRVAEAFSRAAPATERYLSLREALDAHLAIAGRGGWPAIPDGPPLALGADDDRCAVIRERLRLSGDIADTSRSRLFDAALEQGVRRFQARHGLPENGKLDRETLAALAVPLAERTRTLAMNLERARWLTAPLPEPCIRVNIPEYRLRLMSGGVDSLPMRVVVGLSTNPTPVFSDVMTYLEFNPVWRVPKRIVAEELLPGFRRDRAYFPKHHMRVLSTSRRGLPEVDPASVPWQQIGSDSFRYLVQQDAGPANPLGQVKFMMPNEHDVYLHDTSARGFFRRDVRALSHGCVRVQHPQALALFALRGRPQATRDSLKAILDTKRTRRVTLARPIPVHLEYWTAWVDSSGAVNFRPDLYRLDARMDDAIRGDSTARFVLNPTTDWRPGGGVTAARIAHAPDPEWTPVPRPGADSTARDSTRQ